MRLRDLTLAQAVFLIFVAIVTFLSINVIMFGWLTAPSG